ncbi:MAG: aldolase [Candidatus Kerfeldbacteria bacterium]|nr:aldolase [Candidatus Kerfeldbacteria bacterium]
MNTHTRSIHRRQSSGVRVPAHVPIAERRRYIYSYSTVTRGTGRLMLMAGDQKIEHLNADFYGKGIHQDDSNPEHLFQIAHKGDVGCLATQHGLIAAYGMDYPDVPYLVKMNAKTDIVPTAQAEPLSKALCSLDDVIRLRQYGKLNIVGIGYTIYFGSEHESEMLAEAGKLIAAAHALGMIAVVWAYPRGKAVQQEKDAHLIAGVAGACASLGADFVKVNMPTEGAAALHEASQAAGRSGVVVSGGGTLGTKEFLQHTYDTIHLGGARGSATGRNIHQKSLTEAVAITKALSAIVYKNASVDSAHDLYTHSL